MKINFEKFDEVDDTGDYVISLSPETRQLLGYARKEIDTLKAALSAVLEDPHNETAARSHAWEVLKDHF